MSISCVDKTNTPNLMSINCEDIKTNTPNLMSINCEDIKTNTPKSYEYKL
jgi:hypothetical protein